MGRALLPPKFLAGRVLGWAVVDGDGTLPVVGDQIVREAVPRGIGAAVDVLRLAGAADPAPVPAAWAVLRISHGQCTL